MSLKRFFQSSILAVAFAVVMFVPSVNAQTTSPSLEEMLKTIQTLMTQIETLQKQLSTMRGEIKAVIRDGIAEGMSGDDITKLQELLASDPSIYPEGRVTGYFGPMTKEAIKRLQTRHELPATGIVDADTKTILEGYLSERFGETIPPGLLRAPGIAKKIEARAASDCSKPGRALGPLCKKIKTVHDDDSDDDSRDDNFNVEIEIEDGTTTIEFRYKGKNYSTETDSSDEADVLEAVAMKLATTVAKLDTKLVTAVKAALEDALETESDTAENEAEEAIADAEKAINEADDAIDAAEAGESKDDASEVLAQAEAKLADAKKALEEEDYEEAEDLADEAKELADDAEDLVAD